jgi:hypothetical protein
MGCVFLSCGKVPALRTPMLRETFVVKCLWLYRYLRELMFRTTNIEHTYSISTTNWESSAEIGTARSEIGVLSTVTYPNSFKQF